MAMFAHVASDSSRTVLPNMNVRHNIHKKQMDGYAASLNSSLEHEVWVSFYAGYEHPSGDAFARQHTPHDGLKQAASDWRVLQHG